MTHAPTLAELRRHEVPEWFHDAKLGIFVHWGPYSVPGWAQRGASVHEQVAASGWEAMFAANPYAEWYLNSLRLGDTPTRRRHDAVYGSGHGYDEFATEFVGLVERWEPDDWVALFARAGARYAVLTTKHHDGFLLWPSEATAPTKPGRYATRRDVVGDLAAALRARGLRFGAYYSGGLDWSFCDAPVRRYEDLFDTIVQSDEFVAYSSGHFRELIERYRPSILWNDIGLPRRFDREGLVAAYYDAVPDGLVNDRWSKALPNRDFNSAEMNDPLDDVHSDFTTPEYARYDEIRPWKWEATRGLGHSFGYNRDETDDEYLSVRELVHTLVDVVSKNGNLLIGVGPAGDGTIPAAQRHRLLGLGDWLAVNGAAIFGTRPWRRAEGRTRDGLDVRFTHDGDRLFAVVLDAPRAGELAIEALVAAPGTDVRLLGSSDPLAWRQEGGDVVVTLPRGLPDADARTFALSPAPVGP